MERGGSVEAEAYIGMKDYRDAHSASLPSQRVAAPQGW
jgi:3-methyladenine DNA glycosylase Mpg